MPKRPRWNGTASKDKDETVIKHNKQMQQTSTEGVQKKTWQGGKSDPLGIVQEIKI